MVKSPSISVQYFAPFIRTSSVPHWVGEGGGGRGVIWLSSSFSAVTFCREPCSIRYGNFALIKVINLRLSPRY